MLRLNAPYYLLLLLTLIIPALRLLRKRSSGEIIFGSVICLPKTKLTWRILLARMLPLIYLLAIALIIVALSKPQSPSSTSQTTADAIAIEMVLDISGSMETTDTNGTSRLTIATDSFTSFIKERENDLIGLITFSGYATTRAPLTTNHDILRQLIMTVATPNSKTAIDISIHRQETLTALGDAIATACARLKPAKPVSKIIVLITDGISNAGIVEPLKAAHIAKQLNIKIYPINIASNSNDTQQSLLLQKIANITAGKSFNTANQESLTAIMTEINRLETTEVETTYRSNTTDFSIIFITIALLLIIISATINIAITRRLI